jgi:hypothetical protein
LLSCLAYFKEEVNKKRMKCKISKKKLILEMIQHGDEKNEKMVFKLNKEKGTGLDRDKLSYDNKN